MSTLDKYNNSPLRYNPLPPETMLDLLSARLASFVYNIEKGEGEWFTSCNEFKVDKWEC